MDVDFGSYDNQVELPRPDHMKARTDMPSSNQETICIDRCVSDEIQGLWDRGIRTTGCCCGHNKRAGYIGVIDEDIPAMKKIGYTVYPNDCRPGDEDSFYLLDDNPRA